MSAGRLFWQSLFASSIFRQIFMNVDYKLRVFSFLQNSSLTWYTEDPEFTKCFEQTVLIWVPCLFLWTFASLEVYYILSSKKRDIPWNWLNVSKLLITVILIVLSFSDIVASIAYSESGEFNIYNVDIYTPIIKILSFVSII